MSVSTSIASTAKWCARYFKEGHGYAFYLVWTFSLYGSLGPIGIAAPTAVISAVQLASMISIALAGALVGLLAHRLSPLRDKRLLMAVVGILGAASSAVQALSSLGALDDGWFVAASAVAGFSSGLLVSAWLERFLAQGLHSVVWSYCICTLAAVAMSCVLGLLPRPAAWTLIALMPLASVVGLLRAPAVGTAGAHEGPSILAQEGAGPSFGASDLKSAIRVLAVVVLSGLATQVLRMQGDVPDPTLPAYALLLVALCSKALGSIGATVVATYAYAFHTSAIFYLSIPATTAVALLTLFQAGNPAVAVPAVFVASMCDQLVASLAICLFYDFRGGRRPLLSYVGALVSLQVVGTSLGVSVMGLASDAVTPSVAVLVCMIAMSLVVMSGTQSFSMKSFPRADGKGATAAVDVAQKIAKIAATYGLTNREQEVLRIWGTGHTSAYIEEQLCITRSTVRTHLVHIYEKTGTKNKEELLQLIDAQGTAPRQDTTPRSGARTPRNA